MGVIDNALGGFASEDFLLMDSNYLWGIKIGALNYF